MYLSGLDPHFSCLMTRSNFCYAMFAEDWIYSDQCSKSVLVIVQCHAVSNYIAYIGWAHEVVSSHADFHEGGYCGDERVPIANFVWAHAASYSDTVSHNVAHIMWAQDVACSHT